MSFTSIWVILVSISVENRIQNPNSPNCHDQYCQSSQEQLIKEETNTRLFPWSGGPPSNQASAHSEGQKEISSLCSLLWITHTHYMMREYFIQIPNTIPVWCCFLSTTQLILKPVLYNSQNDHNVHLNLDPLHLHPPGPGRLIQDVLHQVTDHLPLRQDLRQSLKRLEIILCSRTVFPFLIYNWQDSWKNCTDSPQQIVPVLADLNFVNTYFCGFGKSAKMSSHKKSRYNNLRIMQKFAIRENEIHQNEFPWIS